MEQVKTIDYFVRQGGGRCGWIGIALADSVLIVVSAYFPVGFRGGLSIPIVVAILIRFQLMRRLFIERRSRR